MSLSSLAALSADPREQEVRMLVQLVRLSRVTVLLAEAGSDKSAVVRSSVMPLLQDDDGATGEIAVLLDSWHEAPLSILNARIDEALARSVGSAARDVRDDGAAGSLCARLALRQQAFERTFIIVLDRFEEYLAASADRPDIVAFESQFVEAVNSRSLHANFLLSLDEDAAPLLARLRDRIPGLSDARVRLPKIIAERPEQAESDPGASREQLVGSSAAANIGASTGEAGGPDAAASAASEKAADESARDAFAAMFFGSEAQRQPFRQGASLAERVASMRAEYELQRAREDAEPGASTIAALFQQQAAARGVAPEKSREVVSAGEPVGPIADLTPDLNTASASAPDARDLRSDTPAGSGEARPRSIWPRAIMIGIALVLISALIVLGTRRIGEPAPAPTQTGAPLPPAADQQAAQPPADQQAQTDAATMAADETPLRSEDVYATPKDDMGELIEPPVSSTPTEPPVVASTDAARETPQVEQAASAPSATPQAPAAARDTEASSNAPSGPLLYIHIRTEGQRAHAVRMIEPLARHGIRVSGIKLVSYGPPVSDLRYFRSADREEALRVNRALDAIGAPAQHLKYIGGFEKSAPRRQYELWLPPY